MVRSNAMAVVFFCALGAFNRTMGAESEDLSKSSSGGAVRVLIARYSLTGNTEQMAKGVAEGVKGAGAVGLLKKVDEVSQQDLEAAEAIVLGCPTYYANIPGKMKSVIDDWSWKMKVDFTDKVGGAFATGGGTSGRQGACGDVVTVVHAQQPDDCSRSAVSK